MRDAGKPLIDADNQEARRLVVADNLTVAEEMQTNHRLQIHVLTDEPDRPITQGHMSTPHVERVKVSIVFAIDGTVPV